jgi:hypothetical protein
MHPSVPKSRLLPNRESDGAARGAKRSVLVALLFAALSPLSRAADTCAERAVQWQEINVGSAIYTERAVANAPLVLRVPVGVDAELQAECLRREGFDPAASMAAEVAKSERCRQNARRVRLVRRDGGDQGPRIGGVVDEASYRECLGQPVEVEVLPGR